MKIEIWSDLVCPFCYIGKRNLEAALKRFPRRSEFEIVWKSFELDPSPDRDPSKNIYQRLAEKYAQDLDWAKETSANVAETAQAAGLTFNWDRAVPANTFDAHRLAHLAASRGLQNEAEERLMAAYFTEGKNIGDRATLKALAADIGLAADEAARALDGDAFAEDVRRDEKEAAGAGIRAVPFFLFNREMYVSGAQPVETFLFALQTLTEKSKTS